MTDKTKKKEFIFYDPNYLLPSVECKLLLELRCRDEEGYDEFEEYAVGQFLKESRKFHVLENLDEDYKYNVKGWAYLS